VVRKIKKAANKTLEDYWEKELRLICKNGYQVRPQQKKQQDSTQLQVLKDLNSTGLFRFKVEPSELGFFIHNTVGWSRIDYSADAPDPIKVYRGPLALIKESPGQDRAQGWALICDSDVAYNQSFYGYSASGAPNGDALVRYLQLFVHSKIWQYYALMTSAKLGFERPNVYKADLDKCPFFPYDKLDAAHRNAVRELSSRLIDEDRSVFSDIDAFFGELYGLSVSDIEVIRDTLEVREPNDELGRRASQSPTKTERATFCRRLESYLRPFFKVLGKQPETTSWKCSEELMSSFVVFTLTPKGVLAVEPTAFFQEQVIPLANQTGSTQIIKEIEGGLLIAILRQYRYWTPSRARLLGAEILREHMTVFED
jgi:hypothetical protein